MTAWSANNPHILEAADHARYGTIDKLCMYRPMQRAVVASASAQVTGTRLARTLKIPTQTGT